MVIDVDRAQKIIYYEFINRQYTHETQKMSYSFWKTFSFRATDGMYFVKEHQLIDYQAEWLAI